MYESASISFFLNMAAYRGSFENEDDGDSCMSCLDRTKYRCLHCKFPLCNKYSIFEDEIPVWKSGKLTRKKPSNKAYSTQHTLSDGFAVSGLKAPFSLFRSRRNVLYFEPARAYNICMNHHC